LQSSKRDARNSNRSTTATRLHWLPSLAAICIGVAAILALPGDAVPTALWFAAAAAVGIAAEAAIWLSPRRGGRTRLLKSGWVLPSLLTFAALLVTRMPPFDADVLRIPGVLAFATILTLVIALQNEQAGRGFGTILGGKLILTLVVYAVAFTLFAEAYQLKLSPSLTALIAGAVAGLLAVVLLRGHGSQLSTASLHAAAIALAVAQVSAGLAFWSAPALVGGALMLLVFYVLAGLAESMLDGVLERRILLEYGIVTVIGLALILSTTPWRA
jgi:hypothetical protein